MDAGCSAWGPTASGERGARLQAPAAWAPPRWARPASQRRDRSAPGGFTPRCTHFGGAPLPDPCPRTDAQPGRGPAAPVSGTSPSAAVEGGGGRVPAPLGFWVPVPLLSVARRPESLTRQRRPQGAGGGARWAPREGEPDTGVPATSPAPGLPGASTGCSSFEGTFF